MSEYKPEDLEAQAGEMDVLAHHAADKRNVDLSTRNRANKYLRAAIMLRAGAQAMRDLEAARERVKELESWLVCAPIESPEDFHAMAMKFVEDMHKARAALQVKPPCRDCDGKGYVPGDPEGALIENCDTCKGTGVKPDVPGIGSKLSDKAKKDIAEIERHAKFYR